MRLLFALLGFTILLTSCQSLFETQKLPILGNREAGPNADTIYHTIPDFSFINQDGQVVNNASFAGKAYVADFFFIACPTICPKTTKQMLRIHDHFKDEPNLLLLAHSVAPKYDTVAALNRYARNLGVTSDKWHFVNTGDQETVYSIANAYFSMAYEDADAPGGYDHSGRLILVDKNRHVRSFCDGTDPADVDRFINDIEKLLNEK